MTTNTKRTIRPPVPGHIHFPYVINERGERVVAPNLERQQRASFDRAILAELRRVKGE